MLLLDMFQQFTFMIKQNEYTNLKISNNTNKYDRQKQQTNTEREREREREMGSSYT